VPTKPLLGYPSHPEFEELLNSCGSMTKQLEALGNKLSVTLLYEGVQDGQFWRQITLNLNNKPVVLALSNCSQKDLFFSTLLKNANITPIGKFLFAANSLVTRDADMQLDLVTRAQIEFTGLGDYLKVHNYQSEQLFWQRRSSFHYRDETLQLIEILLPELESFFNQITTQQNN
jgi:chorismate-pyruvate lyase